MKLNTSSSDQTLITEMGGHKVSLWRLDAKAVLLHGTPKSAHGDLRELMAPKVDAYKVGPLDTLLVTVWDHPELTLPLGQFRTDAATGMVVDEEGYLYYPHIGRIKVAGLTVVQVRDSITQKLDRFLKNPQVDVKILAFRSQKVFVSGEVKIPAVYNITDVPFTLPEAINRAGGFNPTADNSRLLLTRGAQTWSLNFLELVGPGNRIGQIQLRDGDTLHVPHRDEAPVYMLGEVQRPGAVPMHHGRTTLAQAISEVGGINNLSASAKSIYVIRRGESDNGVDVFHLDAHNPVAMVMADRFALRPRDIVFVDAGTLVRWNRVLSMILPTTNIFTNIPTVISDSKNAW